MEQDKELTKLEYFYESDLKIKQIMVDMAPTDIDLSSEDSLIKYSDRLSNDLQEIYYYFNYIMDNLYLGSNSKIVNQKLKEIENELIHTPINSSSLKNFYRLRISDMNESIVKGLNDTYAGFKLFSNEYPYIEQSKTINELLHVFHHAVTNNNLMHERIKPIKESNPTDSCLNSVYRGKLMGDALALYNKALEVIPDFPFDIISLDKKIIMMIRDKGHALTFEIDRDENGGYDINYFIPKLINVDMINNLKGINKVPEDICIRCGVTGQLYCKDMEEMLNDVINIADKTPCDEDMERGYNK